VSTNCGAQHYKIIDLDLSVCTHPYCQGYLTVCLVQAVTMNSGSRAAWNVFPQLSAKVSYDKFNRNPLSGLEDKA
jgi:hypothetical protein